MLPVIGVSIERSWPPIVTAGDCGDLKEHWSDCRGQDTLVIVERAILRSSNSFCNLWHLPLGDCHTIKTSHKTAPIWLLFNLTLDQIQNVVLKTSTPRFPANATHSADCKLDLQASLNTLQLLVIVNDKCYGKQPC